MCAAVSPSSHLEAWTWKPLSAIQRVPDNHVRTEEVGILSSHPLCSSPLMEALMSSQPLLHPRFLLRPHQLGSPSCFVFYNLPVVTAFLLGLQKGWPCSPSSCP
ncbi:hypothetical protein LEMLEM_LOCUS27272 [Lemmus lemmus]